MKTLWNVSSTLVGAYMLSLAGSSLAWGAVPPDWIRGSERALAEGSVSAHERFVREVFAQQRDDRSEQARDFDRYFQASERLAHETVSRKVSSWYLQSLKAELGIAVEGELGFLGAEGEAAVELIWTRKKEAVARLVEKAAGREGVQGTAPLEIAPLLDATEASVPAPDSAVLSTEMSEQALKAQVSELASGVLSQNPKIKNPSGFRASLARAVAASAPLLRELADAPAEWSWVPYKFQQEFFIQAEGAVSPVVKLGAVARVRIEWSIQRKPKTTRAGNDAWRTGMTAWMRALDQAVAREVKGQKPFKLAAFKVGVGVGGELELGVAELKGSAVGSLFFKRVARPQSMPLVYAEAPLPLWSGPSEGGKRTSLSSSQLATALTKALRMAGAITDRAAAYEVKRESDRREFELGAIEVELELTTEGEVFLPGVAQRASAELFFVRGGVL